MNTISTKLNELSKDIGIRPKELKRLCLRAGLELLQRGELKITPRTPKKIPA